MRNTKDENNRDRNKSNRKGSNNRNDSRDSGSFEEKKSSRSHGNKNRRDNPYNDRHESKASLHDHGRSKSSSKESRNNSDRNNSDRNNRDRRDDRSYSGRNNSDRRDDRSYGSRNNSDRRDDRSYGSRNNSSSRSYGKKDNRNYDGYDKKDKFDKKNYDGRKNIEGAEQKQSPVIYDDRNAIYDDQYEVENNNVLIGRNAVSEALKGEREVDKLFVLKDAEGSIKKIIGQAKEQRIIINFVEKSVLDRISPEGNHQGIIAMVTDFEYSTIQDILHLAKEKDEKPFVIVLDNLEDPHNLGAIIRSAECAGAHGVIIPKRRSASVNATVSKASAGATEYMKVAKVTNINSAISELKEAGLWIGACDMDGEVYYKATLDGPVGIVIGSEGNGISKLVKQNCDFVVSIPMVGNISSLNASNAAAILMYEIRKQRDVK